MSVQSSVVGFAYMHIIMSFSHVNFYLHDRNIYLFIYFLVRSVALANVWLKLKTSQNLLNLSIF